MRTRRIACACAALALAAGCQAFQPEPERIATAEVAVDLDTYAIERVGLLPFDGRDVPDGLAHSLEQACLAEFSRTTPWELVPLAPSDLAEIQGSEPHRLGWYEPATITELARRHELDAIFFGTVLRHQFFPPQSLSVQVELVAAETGQVLWRSRVHLDARDPRVRAGLEAYFEGDEPATSAEGSFELALLSPSRFARFAAWQVAELL